MSCDVLSRGRARTVNTSRRITLVTHSGTATRTNDATGFGFNMLSEEGSEGEAGAGTNVGARGRMDGWSM